MTITHIMEVDSDEDIVIEEVSKIYRCKDCCRCFLSLSKYSEHFPKYHPQKTKESISSPEQSSTGVQQASKNDDSSVQILNKTIVPKQKTISLKTLWQSTEKDADGEDDENSDDDSFAPESEIGNSKEDNFMETAINVRRKIFSSVNNVEDISTKTNCEPPSMPPVSMQPNSAIQPSSNGEVISGESSAVQNIGRLQQLPPQQQVNNAKESKTFEVITLSDSDDDNDDGNAITNTFTRQIHPLMKQEIDCNEEDENATSEPSKNLDELVVANEPMLAEPEKESDNALFKPFEKNYSCKYCTKCFSRDRTLQSHMKGMHRAEIEAEKNGYAPQEQGGATKKKGKGKQKSVPAGSTSQSTPKKVPDNPKRPARGGGNTKKAKQQKRQKVGPEVEENQEEDIDESQPMLAFSCKWCPEKFLTLEQLKRHAINLHIKYKTLA